MKLTVNGDEHTIEVEPRHLLADVLRERLGLTGTTVSCGHGVCGSCTVLVDGSAQRSCLILAVQCDGAIVTTVEGLASADGSLHPLQQAFTEHHALQCGFCTPGFLMLLAGELAENPLLDEDEQRLSEVSASNICRCTGYEPIRSAAVAAAQAMRSVTSERE
ncbi:MAG: (2Fe-2S)-binding protein [Pseudonocardiales bacterium]|nr:(2Fe-2S)-binding protein [Pseudonocardiales bacterium]